MYNGKKILGLIPARGGSKGLPGKNIMQLCGKPLIAWTIEQARGSSYLDRAIVSTDSEQIAQISRKYGGEVPFLRPDELATDEAKLIDTIVHILEWPEIKSCAFDIVMLLQPTSPLRTSEDIDRSIELLVENKSKAVISVCEAEHHPLWANALPPDGSMKDFLRPEILHKRRQELPTYYRLNGVIFAGYCDYLIQNRGFYGRQTCAYIMPRERSVDIDGRLDFLLAEAIIKSGKAENENTVSCIR